MKLERRKEKKNSPGFAAKYSTMKIPANNDIGMKRICYQHMEESTT
jgi:hypothetical protein